MTDIAFTSFICTVVNRRYGVVALHDDVRISCLIALMLLLGMSAFPPAQCMNRFYCINRQHPADSVSIKPLSKGENHALEPKH